MTEISPQKKAELWILKQHLPKKYNSLKFKEEKLELIWGGKFAFDAVSSDLSIIGLISTNSSKTSTNKTASAKIMKIKADALYLTNIKSENYKKLFIFTEILMYDFFKNESNSGRFPNDIELVHVELPEDLREDIENARIMARKEVAGNNLEGK